MFVNYCYKGSQGGIVIEASYITVHSYDILVINTHHTSKDKSVQYSSYTWCITNRLFH